MSIYFKIVFPKYLFKYNCIWLKICSDRDGVARVALRLRWIWVRSKLHSTNIFSSSRGHLVDSENLRIYSLTFFLKYFLKNKYSWYRIFLKKSLLYGSFNKNSCGLYINIYYMYVFAILIVNALVCLLNYLIFKYPTVLSLYRGRQRLKANWEAVTCK